MSQWDTAALAIALAVGSIAFGMVSRLELFPVACPAVLEDGRPLISSAADGSRCSYAPPPRGCENYSSEEMFRMARTKQRMERVTKKEIKR